MAVSRILTWLFVGPLLFSYAAQGSGVPKSTLEGRLRALFAGGTVSGTRPDGGSCAVKVAYYTYEQKYFNHGASVAVHDLADGSEVDFLFDIHDSSHLGTEM